MVSSSLPLFVPAGVLSQLLLLLRTFFQGLYLGGGGGVGWVSFCLFFSV